MPRSLTVHGSLQAAVDRPGSLTRGHRACPGCGEALAARWVLDAAVRATGGQLLVVTATGCLEVFSTPYPESAWRVPWLHSLFGNAAAVASGVAAAMAARGSSGVRVLAQGGDGGTTDIGFGCLSGMFERNDDVLYVCYDNEAYMNTGVQRSSATPVGARTSTTPRGSPPGTGKNVPLLAVAHEIPWVGTASIADVHDLEAKVARAMAVRGARYLHVQVPCPLGWGSASEDTIRLARLAVESGLFPVFEARHGRILHAKVLPRRIPVDDYLRAQSRFAHLFDEANPAAERQRAEIQRIADHNVERFGLDPRRAEG